MWGLARGESCTMNVFNRTSVLEFAFKLTQWWQNTVFSLTTSFFDDTANLTPDPEMTTVMWHQRLRPPRPKLFLLNLYKACDPRHGSPILTWDVNHGINPALGFKSPTTFKSCWSWHKHDWSFLKTTKNTGLTQQCKKLKAALKHKHRNVFD